MGFGGLSCGRRKFLDGGLTFFLDIVVQAVLCLADRLSSLPGGLVDRFYETLPEGIGFFRDLISDDRPDILPRLFSALRDFFGNGGCFSPDDLKSLPGQICSFGGGPGQADHGPDRVVGIVDAMLQSQFKDALVSRFGDIRQDSVSQASVIHDSPPMLQPRERLSAS